MGGGGRGMAFEQLEGVRRISPERGGSAMANEGLGLIPPDIQSQALKANDPA
ncbi:MAG: hypothetical protein RLZZ356_1709 [Verrucomicrobiota bacterium]